jgi:hypothetical protein
MLLRVVASDAAAAADSPLCLLLHGTNAHVYAACRLAASGVVTRAPRAVCTSIAWHNPPCITSFSCCMYDVRWPLLVALVRLWCGTQTRFPARCWHDRHGVLCAPPTAVVALHTR